MHNKEEDAWFIYEGSVYDATAHLKEIKDYKTSTFLAIMRILGTDCTEEMNEIRHSPAAMSVIKQYKIGELIELK